MYNKVILIGRLTADPELRQTPNGVAVVSFSIAVDRRFSSKDGERQTDFINVVAWRQHAEFIAKYFAKGKLILVEGTLQSRRYTDKEGNNRTAFEVVADAAQFAETKASSQAHTGGSAPMGQQQPASYEPAVSYASGDMGDFAEIDSDSDDLPF